VCVLYVLGFCINIYIYIYILVFVRNERVYVTDRSFV